MMKMMDYHSNKPQPLSREYLLKRGKCCNSGCTNCPYKTKNNKMSEEIKVSEENIKIITEYVYKNYKTYKDKPLTIRESGNCFHILKHEDGSPLILGKGIVK